MRTDPGQLRRSVGEARERVRLLAAVLRSNAGEERWGLGDEFGRAAHRLDDLLRQNDMPLDYRVAVIGRFKAGKSTFLNALLDEQLAGVNVRPETAAVSTFRHGPKVVANINMLPAAGWEELRRTHEAGPADADARRYADWLKFAGPRLDGKSFDLAAIAAEHLAPEGRTIRFGADPRVPDEMKRWRDRMKDYTSGERPWHLLVRSIEVEAPSPLLQQGVTLIDTPGLGDTERFRQELTDKAVEDIDAVLFLTTSGAAYDQSEKEFLTTLLRRGSVKQLVFVVTKVDVTYESHVKSQEDLDEPVDPIGRQIDLERRRLRLELERTFDDVAQGAGAAQADRFREQLDSVEIAFTSASNHRDHKRGEPVRHALAPEDPGGMNAARRVLFDVLSTESRVAVVRSALETGALAILDGLTLVIENRRQAVRSIRNREVAEQRLATFRGELGAHGERFAEAIGTHSRALNDRLQAALDRCELSATGLASDADAVMTAYQIDDAATHWRTRRSGRWGYLTQLQGAIANRIFARFTDELQRQVAAFDGFLADFAARLGELADQARLASERAEMSVSLDVGADLDAFATEAAEDAQTRIELEGIDMNRLLSTFVSEQVEDRIAAARAAVAGELGRGTALRQTGQVNAFYAEVRRLLRVALEEHLRTRYAIFAEHLRGRAKALPEEAVARIGAQLDRAAADIRVAVEADLEGRREAFEAYADERLTQLSGARADISRLLGVEASDERRGEAAAGAEFAVSESVMATVEEVELAANPRPASPETDASGIVTPETIRRHATRLLTRLTLQDGRKGWPMDKIFRSDLLQGAREVWLLEPYLSTRYQRRNLQDFVNTVASAARAKAIHVVTKTVDTDATDADDFFFNLDRQAFEATGTRVTITEDADMHDRFVIANNGVVFKLGRGLDIYKPSTGLASRNAALRAVRSCEIDVFGPEEA